MSAKSNDLDVSFRPKEWAMVERAAKAEGREPDDAYVSKLVAESLEAMMGKLESALPARPKKTGEVLKFSRR